MPSKRAELVSLATAATAIGGAWKFGEFLYKAKRVRDVGPANAVYVRLINRVRADLDEVKRLLTVPEVRDALEANPPKAKWVYGAMRDVRGALEVITPLTERVASDVEDGRRVGIRHRIRWLISEQEKLENREKELLVAHSSLNECIGFLTALEPAEGSQDGQSREEGESRRIEEKETWSERERDPRRVEVREEWIENDGPRRVEERDIRIERHHEHHHDPRRVEVREEWVEREGPRRVEEREVRFERHHDPRRVEVKEEWVERGREPKEHRYEEHLYDRRGGERELRVERDGRHVEVDYYDRRPGHKEEKHYEERFDARRGPPRRSSDEDREPERESFMQSTYRRTRTPYGQYGEYAEYGAPQPIGPAEYRHREVGDPGFGDELVTNPQPVPPLPYSTRGYEREEWIEEKEDYRYDKYGNRLPEQPWEQRTRYPRSRL